MEKIKIKRKDKSVTKEELLLLDKEDLIDKILQLEAHNLQLKNIISKNLQDGVARVEKRKKPFDFSKCNFRRVLLRFAYFGWDYQGLAVQEDTTQTIEHHLFHALTKSCLIESREKSQYHRCGRTDKGVSSFGQVISISLRSKYSTSEQNLSENVNNEIEYCKILNRLLPQEIRVISWMPTPTDRPEYSARFDCKSRIYKYYFPKGDLDISAMNEACKHLVGSHDFRNLCKMDVGNGVTVFIRDVISAQVLPLDRGNSDSATSMHYLRIEGNAFLWHQIRCIFGLLLLIGMKKESGDVIRELLDVTKNPKKPQYNMALDVPLNLFRCDYDVEDDWLYDPEEMRNTLTHFQAYWTIHSVKTTMIQDCLMVLQEEYSRIVREGRTDGEEGALERDIRSHAHCLLQGVKPKIYKPLLERNTCSSLEERIEHYRKKRKIDHEVGNK